MTAIRHAKAGDLPAIVAIYNAAIPGGMATADLEPVSVASRDAWFRGFSAQRRPLWVASEGTPEGPDVPVAWLSLHSFYGRAAYDATVEVSVYCAPEYRRHGHSRALLRYAAGTAPALGLSTFVAYVFRHNLPSLALFESEGFAHWGLLPGVANLGGVRRDLVILGRRLGAE
ncbi:MAG TPA: GNAT family N-acetyltransferase [Casimicrobiaceae bacterium]